MKQSWWPWIIGAMAGVFSSPLLPVLALNTMKMVSGALAVVMFGILFLSLSIAWKQRARVTSGVLFIGGVFCGIWWSLFNLSLDFSWQLDNRFWREPAEITIRVTEASVADSFRTRITGCLVSAPELWKLPTRSCSVRIRAYWYEQQRPEPQIGEKWKFNARLRPASGTLNGLGFDYQKYLLRHHIRFVGSVHGGEIIADPPRYSVARLQNRIFQRLARYAPVLEHEGMLLALGLGDRQWLSAEDWQVLQRTGLAHIIAISGLHLALVFSGCVWLLKRLLQPSIGNQWFTLIGAFTLACVYAALAGFSITTTRALLLIFVYCVMRLSRSKKSSHAAWCFAVLLILWLDPLAWMDTGFWLSAGAVFAIFSWYWRFRPRHFGSRWSKVKLLWRFEVMLLVTLTPLSILYFQGVAWLAPITNLLVVPIFSLLILPLTLISMILASFWLPGALILWQGLDLVFGGLMKILTLLSEWPGSWIEVWQPQLGGWLLVGVLICCLPVANQIRFNALGATVIAFVLWRINLPTVPFALHFMDVGQGSALVIQQGSQAALIDTGPSYGSGYNAGEQVLVPFLKRFRLQPEWGVITHTHQDHRGGKAGVEAEFPDLYWLESQNSERGCYFGQQWLWGEMRIRVLSPLPGPRYGANNSGCVLLLEYQTQRILLPADSEDINELRLLGRYGALLNADVLAVAHHGSQRSSLRQFLHTVKPAIAVVSRGFANQFGMPNESVKKRFHDLNIALYDTGRHGRVSLYYDKSEATGWRVEMQRDPNRTPWFHRLPEER